MLLATWSHDTLTCGLIPYSGNLLQEKYLEFSNIPACAIHDQNDMDSEYRVSLIFSMLSNLKILLVTVCLKQ